MARPANVARIVLSGSYPGGEIWSTGFWMSDTGVHDNATAVALAEICGGTLNADDSSGAMRETIEALCSAACQWLSVSAYFYLGGSNIAAYSGTWNLPTPRVGTQIGFHPNQVALVCSLRTARAGRQNRGRMFLPANAVPLANNGQLSGTYPGTIAGAWQTAFNDINASAAGKIVVVSDAGSAYHPVTQVIVDSRMDIQRTRANKQTPAFRSALPITP